MIFLLHYDRPSGELVYIKSYDDKDRDIASRDKLDLEISLLGSNGSAEVVLLEAETQEDLRSTHSRYFETLEQLKSSKRS